MEMNIGNKIKTLRKQRGITQEQLAEAIGISFQAVSKWECGFTYLKIPHRQPHAYDASITFKYGGNP